MAKTRVQLLEELYAAVVAIRAEQVSLRMGFGKTEHEKKDRAITYVQEIARQSKMIDDLLSAIEKAT